MLAADAREAAEDPEVLLNLNETDLLSGVQQATRGKGVDIVLDTVGANCSALACVRSGLGEGRLRSPMPLVPMPRSN